MLLQYKTLTVLIVLFFRSEVLIFAEGEVNKTFMVELLEDDIPEVLEAFRVSLSSPTGGATLGETNSIVVVILTNDNAHGIIGFAPVSTNIRYMYSVLFTIQILPLGFTISNCNGTIRG